MLRQVVYWGCTVETTQIHCHAIDLVKCLHGPSELVSDRFRFIHDEWATINSTGHLHSQCHSQCCELLSSVSVSILVSNYLSLPRERSMALLLVYRVVRWKPCPSHKGFNRSLIMDGSQATSIGCTRSQPTSGSYRAGPPNVFELPSLDNSGSVVIERNVVDAWSA